jgi:hypothetical protein
MKLNGHVEWAALLILWGCSGSGELPAPEPVNEEETAVAAFALTPQCGQCAKDAVKNVCLPQAQACLQDPNCLGVGKCVKQCGKGDPLCLAQCVQSASKKLDSLADCVVCQECPVECAGAWQCGGGGGAGGGGGGNGAGGGGNGTGGGAPQGCDNSGDCKACLMCAVQGPCLQQIKNGQKIDAVKCALCDECKNDCAAVPLPAPVPKNVCGP